MISLRRLALSVLTVVALYAPTASARDKGRPVRSLEEVCVDIAASGPELIEGVWRLTAPGSPEVLIAIERDGSGDYDITVVEAPDRAIVPGTLIGRAGRGSERGVYDAWLYTSSPLASIPGLKRRNFTLRLTDNDNRLTFNRHRSPLAVNLYMSIPYLFMRPSVRTERHIESTPQGAERVFPIPIPPLEPVYL